MDNQKKCSGMALGIHDRSFSKGEQPGLTKENNSSKGESFLGSRLSHFSVEPARKVALMRQEKVDFHFTERGKNDTINL